MQIKNLILDCLFGLEHLNENKLHHLDVKPDNILLIGQDYVLTDFGGMKISENPQNFSMVLTSTLPCSKLYLSPELLE